MRFLEGFVSQTDISRAGEAPAPRIRQRKETAH
jgi:hypothetical protein